MAVGHHLDTVCTQIRVSTNYERALTGSKYEPIVSYSNGKGLFYPRVKIPAYPQPFIRIHFRKSTFSPNRRQLMLVSLVTFKKSNKRSFFSFFYLCAISVFFERYRSGTRTKNAHAPSSIMLCRSSGADALQQLCIWDEVHLSFR